MKKLFSSIKNYVKTLPTYMKVVFVAVLLLCLTVITSRIAIGKYTFSQVTNGTYRAGFRLADTFTLLEHEAVQGSDGSYTLGTDTVVTNEYKLIPGLTIPKDPYITITGKTSIDAYLYLEVIEVNKAAQLSYTIDSGYWTPVDGIAGPHGGSVYYYNRTPVNGYKINDQTTGLTAIPVIASNSFTLTKIPITGSTEALKFCGYLVQAVDGENVTTAFQGKFATVTP